MTVNDVAVGRLPSADYDTLVANSRADKRLLLKQVVNLLSVGFIVAVGMVLFPWALVGFILGLSVWLPEMQGMVAAQDAVSMMVALHPLGPFLLLTGWPFFPALMKRLGYRNVYRESCDQEVRRRLRCAATGVVGLIDDRAWATEAAA